MGWAALSCACPTMNLAFVKVSGGNDSQHNMQNIKEEVKALFLTEMHYNHTSFCYYSMTWILFCLCCVKTFTQMRSCFFFIRSHLIFFFYSFFPHLPNTSRFFFKHQFIKKKKYVHFYVDYFLGFDKTQLFQKLCNLKAKRSLAFFLL